MNVATLYRLEAGRVRPQGRTLTALLDVYGVTDQAERGKLNLLARQADQLAWLQEYESELPEQQTTYISFEAEARTVRNYESLFVPGLLQTKAYAHAVIRGAVPTATNDQVRSWAEARLQRQELLQRDSAFTLWAIVDEATLHREVGDRSVMADQLNHMVNAGEARNVTIQVIPFSAGAHPGMPGSFVVMDFPDPADSEIIYIDSMAGDLFLEKEADIRRYALTFEHLRAQALSSDASARLIETRAKSFS